MRSPLVAACLVLAACSSPGAPSDLAASPPDAAMASDAARHMRVTFKGSGFAAYAGHVLRVRVYEDSFVTVQLNFYDSVALTGPTFTLSWDLATVAGAGVSLYYYVDTNDDGSCTQGVDTNWKASAPEGLDVTVDVTPSDRAAYMDCSNLD